MFEKHVKAQLILQTGERFDCFAFGHIKETVGQLVFCTSMAGYQELLTNPVYAGQIVVLTNPLIGNSGINLEDNESEKIWLNGIAIRERCTYPNNWRLEMEFAGFMKQSGTVGVEGLDVRELTKIIRSKGEMLALITNRFETMTEKQIENAFESHSSKNKTKEVSTKSVIDDGGTCSKVALLDLGVKRSVIEALKERGLSVTLFPWDSKAEDILKISPKGLFISGGPGSPLELKDLINLDITSLVGKMPIMALGLGAQITCLALGGEVEKMKYGCHGDNYSVRDVEKGMVYTTTQSRSFEITKIPEKSFKRFENVNRGNIEGFIMKDAKVLALQFYPDTVSMPHNSGKLYDLFAETVKGGNF